MDALPIITVGLNPAVDRILQVDGFTLGAHQVARSVTRRGAGKSINVSRALAALGVPSVATGLLGRDSRDDFAPVFDDKRITDAFVEVPGRTRENITIVDARARPAEGPPGQARRETHIREPGLAVSAEDLRRLSDRLGGLSAPGRMVAFSGSLPPGATGDDFARLLGACAERGASVAVDTSGQGLAALRAEPPWLVKPNPAELAELVGRDLPGLNAQLAAARELTRRVEIVLLSAGAAGAYLATRAGVLHARADLPADDIVSTVGCGDALLAGFLAGLWHGGDLREALRQAVASATASAATLLPAEFDLGACRALRQRVEVADLG